MALPAELKNTANLAKRFKKAKNRRSSNWWSHFRECYEYAAPQREIFDTHSPGEKKNTDLYDDTAVTGLQKFANRMQKAVCPPWQQWSMLVPGEDNVDSKAKIEYGTKRLPIADVLEMVTDRVFNYIHRSNFASRVYESFIDMGISTGTLTCEYDKRQDKLIFNSVPLAQLYLNSGPNGEIDDHWREHDIEYGQIKTMWPEAKLSQQIRQKIRNSPDMNVKVIEGCIYHAPDNLYYYVVMLNEGKDLIYSQDEGETSPFVSFRGMVVPGEAYGRGPIMQVLPSIKTLNMVKEFELTAAALAASGAWTGRDDGTFNPYTVRVAPGVMIPVGSNDRSNPTISALPLNFDVKYSQVIGDELKQEINKALFAEPLGSTEDPTKTATEIQYRYQMHLEDAGAFFARLQVELIEKLMKRVVHVLKREGIIPPLKLDGRELSLKHTSPIAKIMDYEDLQNLQQAIAETSMLGEETVMLTYDTEKVGEYINEKRGVSPTLYRDEKQRAEVKKQMAEAAQAMAAQQQQQGGGGVV